MLPNSHGCITTHGPEVGRLKSGGHWCATKQSTAASTIPLNSGNPSGAPDRASTCCGGTSVTRCPRRASREQIARLTSANECSAAASPCQAIEYVASAMFPSPPVEPRCFTAESAKSAERNQRRFGERRYAKPWSRTLFTRFPDERRGEHG